ncbi:ABC transporter ATP-binding protein [Deinococcus koreensis]|uniref:ABC transporter ATP-binding protein n=1 Tax=Deinococcus koreensis TaxID=2054903 RepID=A0A2K3UY37_9DEIO|nr:ABC transporter ATP-binding protein [Deinococcus koreensis]
MQIRRGQEVTLHYPDLEVPAGTRLAVTGPSGSGKTSLLHVLAGLLRPQAGAVQVGGLRLDRAPQRVLDAYRRTGVGYVFQDFHLLPGLSALENVELGLRVAGVGDARTRALGTLRALGLGHRLRHRPTELSTGERQRVAVARAVAHRPGLLLVDEPTAHLDRARAQEALSLLIEVARELGSTLIVVTHDPLVAGQLPAQLSLEAAPGAGP